MPVRLQAIYRKVSTLRPHEIWLLLWSAGLLVALPVLQRVLTLPALVTLYGARMVPAILSPLDPERLLFLIQGLLQQHFGMIRPNCMKQSLVLFHLLRQRGAPVTIHFGVAKRDESLDGHCWIELAGQPLGERDDPQRAFAVAYAFPENTIPLQERIAR